MTRKMEGVEQMRGLSEEDIKRFIRAHNIDNEHNWIAGLLLKECRELDPWLPIEGAPSGEPGFLALSNDKDQIEWLIDTDKGSVKYYNKNSNNWTFKNNFSHYKELPLDPACENSADT